jgi:hypothetical protein
VSTATDAARPLNRICILTSSLDVDMTRRGFLAIRGASALWVSRTYNVFPDGVLLEPERELMSVLLRELMSPRQLHHGWISNRSRPLRWQQPDERRPQNLMVWKDSPIHRENIPNQVTIPGIDYCVK